MDLSISPTTLPSSTNEKEVTENNGRTATSKPSPVVKPDLR
jgi:hypothetical protein